MTVGDFDRQFGVQNVQQSSPSPEDVDDTFEARRIVARRYWEIFDFNRMYDTLIHEVAKEMPEADRPQFFRLAAQVLPRDKTEEFFISLSAKYFTRSQLEALAEFHGSPIGRSIASRGYQVKGPSVPSEGPSDTPTDRRVAAQRYFYEIDGRRFYGALMSTLARRFSSIEEAEAFLWQANQDYPKFQNELLDMMERYNTRREIEALTRFHSSPSGRVVLIQSRFMFADLADYVMSAVRQAAKAWKPQRQ